MTRVRSVPSHQARTQRSSGAKQASMSSCTRQGAARSVPSWSHSRRYGRVACQPRGRQRAQDGVLAAAVGQEGPAHPQGLALDLAGPQVRQVLGDGHEAVGAAEHGQDGQEQDVRQGVRLGPVHPRIFQDARNLDQGRRHRAVHEGSPQSESESSIVALHLPRRPTQCRCNRPGSDHRLPKLQTDVAGGPDRSRGHRLHRPQVGRTGTVRLQRTVPPEPPWPGRWTAEPRTRTECASDMENLDADPGGPIV